MKKIILFTALAALFSTIFNSCQKETLSAPAVSQVDTESFAVKTPALKDIKNLTQKFYPVENGAVTQLIKGKELKVSKRFSDYGILFKSFNNGNIKSLKINLPEAGDKLVSLWRLDPSSATGQSLITSVIIPCKNINSWDNSKEVNVPIKANTVYMISVKSNSYNCFNAGKATFPFISGNITLLNFREYKASDKTQEYDLIDKTIPVNMVYGFADFTFQRTPSTIAATPIYIPKTPKNILD